MSHGKTIALIEVRTGRHIAEASGHTAPVTTLAFSPDGRILASGGKDKSVVLWDTVTMRMLRKFSLQGPVSGIRFSAEGERLSIRESDQTRRIFDIATGKEIRSEKRPPLS